MKTITPNIIKFVIVAAFLTVIFRYTLTYGINHNSNLVVVFSALLYAVAMALSGWSFGKKDRGFLPIYDLGFRFHLATYLVHNTVSELWFAFGFSSKNENIMVIHAIAIIWGIFFIGHLIFFLWTRRNAINGLDREALFD